MELKQTLESFPIIAAVKDISGLQSCLESECKVVFILFGNICTIDNIVKQVKDSGRFAVVHIDLITGLSSKDIAVDYVATHIKADGIISIKPSLIHRAKEMGLFAIQRFFLIDSLAFQNVTKQIELCKPDMIEILPGVMPKIVIKLKQLTKIPIIAGGLICDKQDIIAALGAGAIAISTTNTTVWFM